MRCAYLDQEESGWSEHTSLTVRLGDATGAHVPVAIDRIPDALFGDFGVVPPNWLDPGTFEVFVDFEEVLNLPDVVGRELGEIRVVGKKRIVVEHRKDFVIGFAAVKHAEEADGSGFDDTTGECREIGHYEDIERVIVIIVRLGCEAVVARVVHGRIEYAVQLERTSAFVEFVLVARTLGDFDDNVDDFGPTWPRIKLVPQIHATAPITETDKLISLYHDASFYTRCQGINSAMVKKPQLW